MTRLLSLLTFAALAFALLAVPQADPLRLAAVESGNLLTEEVPTASPVEDEDGRTDAERFGATELHVVLNWFEDLKERVPN